MSPREFMRGCVRGRVAAITLLLFSIYFLANMIAVGSDQDVWRAVIVALPTKVSTRDISSTSYYILKQTHEPVFRKDDGYNYTSRILKNWARSIDYRDYTFCPDTSLRFDAFRKFSPELFRHHITGITAKFDSSASILESNGCLHVGFSKPSRRYLDYLSAYANAPTVEISSVAEAGLGPYLVKAIGKDEIVLSRKRRLKGGFNTIHVYDYRGPDDTRLKGQFIADSNFVSTRIGMDFPDSEYVRFETMAPKSMVLLINLPSERARNMVYNCINIDGLRRAFSDRNEPFNDVQTILPVGVPGGIPGKPRQECTFKKSELGNIGPVVLANWRGDRTAQLEKYTEELRSNTGLSIKVVNYQPSALAGLMRTKKRPKGLVVMMTGADSDDNYRLLESYFGKNTLLDFVIPGVGKLYGELIKEDAPDKQKTIAAEIADRISRSWALLPLYQSVTSVYYPRRIKNLNVGKEFLEYPEVAEFRW